MAAERLSLESRVRVSSEVVFRDLDGEMVLLDLASGVYFGLDPVGTRLWHLLGERRGLRPVLGALLDEYDVAPGDGERDLLEFVGALRDHRLVELDDAPSG